MPHTRQAGIIDILLQKEIVRVNDLSALYQVSPVTIRRDLMELEKLGMVKRYYGGAILDETYSKRMNMSNTLNNLAEQRELISNAIELIRPKSIVAITPSKIHETLSHMLPRELDLTIITNSLNVFEIVKDKFSKVILTGGFYMKSTNSFEGEDTSIALERHNIDIAFIGLNGFKDNILYTGTMMESIVKKTLIKISKKNIILVENYKNNYKSNYELCSGDLVTYIMKSNS